MTGISFYMANLSLHPNLRMQAEWRIRDMDIDSFVKIVKNNVKERLGNGYHVTVCEKDKNNGVVYTGVKVEKEDSDISSIIYLNDQFKMHENGNITLSDVTDYIINVSKGKNPIADKKQLLNYDSVSKNIVFKLINTKWNSKLLKDVLRVEFLDLSVVFQCMLAGEFNGIAAMLVHNAHMKLWDVTVDELLEAAKKNTLQLMGCDFKSIKEVICEIMKEEVQGDFDYDTCMAGLEDSVPMYVLSNRYRVEGAACMLYPKILLDICEKLKSSFYIIPSSIHEVLILPSDNTSESREILAMIKEINDTQVSAEEILSYSLYYYDADRRGIEICD